MARAHALSKTWIYELVRRIAPAATRRLSHARGDRAPASTKPPEIVGAIVELRGELERQGHDAGAETIAYHLAQTHRDVPSVSTIWRILRREGLVVAEPQKRPRSSLIRFEARSPTSCGRRT